MFTGDKRSFFSHLLMLMVGLSAGWWLHARVGILLDKNIILPRHSLSDAAGVDGSSVTAISPPQEKHQQREKEEYAPIARSRGVEPPKPSQGAGRTPLPAGRGDGVDASPKPDPSADFIRNAIVLYNNRDLSNLLLFVQEHEYSLGRYYPEAVNLLKNLLLEVAVELTEKGYPQKALESIDAYLDFDPRYIDAIDIKAKIFSFQGRAVEAFDLYMDALFFTDDPVIQTDLRNKAANAIEARVLSLWADEKWNELMLFYERILERDLEKPEKYQLGLARLYLKFNRPDTAGTIAEEILLTDSTNPEALDLLKQIEKGRLDEDLMVIPVRKRKNQYYVDAIINNEIETVLLIDTGATYCSLASSVVDELTPASFTELGENFFNTAGGMVKNAIVRIDSISIGEAAVRNLQVSVSDIYSGQSHMKGLLGMNFLSLFDFYFDQEKNNIILRKKTTNNDG